jgi:hypothetical protein
VWFGWSRRGERSAREQAEPSTQGVDQVETPTVLFDECKMLNLEMLPPSIFGQSETAERCEQVKIETEG